MLISLKNVTHIYEQEQSVKAVDNISLDIDKNEFIGLVGHTGSGKSTLVQLFNALISPTRGKVFIKGKDISQKKVNLKDIRQKIGLVFQYPEHQLFEENIYEEVAFGPKNLGLSENEINNRVKETLDLVEMDYAKFKDRSPFNLSGGQQRRVAIAGVLAMEPELLILDEPFAGLDPEGRKQLIKLLKHLHQDLQITVVLISHHMEEIANLSTRVIVLSEGKIVLDGTPEEVFTKKEEIEKLSLNLPQITEVMFKLKERGLNVETNIFTVNEAAREISSKLRSKFNVK
ncbi:MAG: energy-coupling factor transporter ATPase [Bacillota bacterium]